MLSLPLPALIGAAALAAVSLAPPPPLPPLASAAAQGSANVPYDGRFTFVRLQFDPSLRRGFGGYTPPWAHDYPRAERNLMSIVEEITLLRAYRGGSNVLKTDDPELLKYPLAYISEPGYWTQTEAEVLGLRNYLLKGGFLIVDDFRGGDLYNFEAEIRRVLPGAQLVDLEVTHPIFQSFFPMTALDLGAPTFRRYTPTYYGIYENNDRAQRLVAIVNYNNDIGDYWEYSDTGWLPVDLSNAAYKLGINYIMYAMTH